MPVRINVDVTEAVKAIRLGEKQIPFVLAKTLTNSAKVAHEAAKASLRSQSAFTLRNSWTESGIRYKPASKAPASGRIEADVHTDFSRRPGATDYLALQDADYVKTAQHTFLCIPTDTLRTLAGGRAAIIPDELRPRNLLMYADRQFKYEVERGRNRGKVRGLSNRAGSAGAAIRGMVFFTDTHTSGGGRKPLLTKSGARGIWCRTIGDNRQAYLLWVMVKHTGSVRKRVFIPEVVQQSVDANFMAFWEKNWRDAFARGVRV